MTLLDELRKIDADEFKTRLKITFLDGDVIEGLYVEYNDAFDNAEEIASVNIVVSKDKPEICVMENEIAKIEKVT